jgi:putative tricarboxylic transport membrane protein
MNNGVNSGPANTGFRSRIRGPRNFYGGLALIILAALAIWAASDLPGQEGFLFGPGTAPRLFAGLLMAVGVLIAVTGLLVDGPPVEGFAIRGPFYVLLAIISFALLMRGGSIEPFGVSIRFPALGMVPSTFLAFMISIFGSKEFRIVESLLAAAAMTAFCVVLFSYMLALPFPLWPQF